jgi:membrane protein GlpM
MDIFLKALFGALIVVVIQLLAKTKNYYIAGLIPLFPTFTLISHYIVGTQRTTDDLKATIRFGGVSLIPYVIYLITLYLLVDRFKLTVALLLATLAWFIAAILLMIIWNFLT